MKTFRQIRESIIDIPRSTYAPMVFDDADTSNPKIKQSVIGMIEKQMEDFEKEHIFGEEDFVQKKYLSLRSECEKLLKRINFENKELDKLESQTLEVEEKIINTLSDYAKKQKK